MLLFFQISLDCVRVPTDTGIHSFQRVPAADRRQKNAGTHINNDRNTGSHPCRLFVCQCICRRSKGPTERPAYRGRRSVRLQYVFGQTPSTKPDRNRDSTSICRESRLFEITFVCGEFRQINYTLLHKFLDLKSWSKKSNSRHLLT